MGYCWYCHWGWAEPVVEVFRRNCKRLDDLSGMNYGDSLLESYAGHIVWADENFDDASIDFCLKECDDMKQYEESLLPEELDIVRQSLLELKAIPEEIRCCQHENYDGEHPENFPPTINVIRV